MNGWDQARLQAAEERINELNAEIARHHADFERWEEMAAQGAGRLAEIEKLKAENERLKANLDVRLEDLRNNAAHWHRTEDERDRLLQRNAYLEGIMTQHIAS